MNISTGIDGREGRLFPCLEPEDEVEEESEEVDPEGR